MLLQIESPCIDLNKNLASLIHNKFEHIGKRYDRIGHCDVLLREEKSDTQKHFLVEAKIKVPKAILFASEKAVTFEMAIEKVITDLEHQLNRHKEEINEVR